MDILKDKVYDSYNYMCRYSNVPRYYNTVDDRWQCGIGQNVLKNAKCTKHVVASNDTLDYLSLKYYNDPTYWWVIAYYNDIQDAFINLYEKYKTIKIPNISNIEFGELR